MRVLTFKFTLILTMLLASVSLTLAQTTLQKATIYLNQNPQKFAINTDVDWRTSDLIEDKSGISHVYFTQTYDGIDVLNQLVSVHLKHGEIFHSTGRFFGKINKTLSNREAINATTALQLALQNRSLTTSRPLVPTRTSREPNKESTYELDDIAQTPVTSKLLYIVDGDQVRLVWNVDIYEKGGQHAWSVRVDAGTSEVINVLDQVIHCDFGAPNPDEYNCRLEELQLMTCEETEEALDNGFMDYSVYGRSCTTHTHNHSHAGHAHTHHAGETVLANTYYAMPLGVESPNHGAFVTLADPANDDPTDTPSPFGWHDTNGAAGAEYTITRGNNVFAYEDTGNNDGPGFSPDGGASLDFNFVPDFGANPISDPTQSAAIVNLFVWSNFMHDVFYNYGFDEASGNFQENNYGNGGTGGDSVNAEAQDGSGSNNANFLPLVEGSNPRMQMYLWTAPNPDKDGDFDNGIIAHEYGHGISTRLTGGPSTNCLNNGEQMGEGWSDWWGLVLSVRPGDNANTVRGIGTYALDQPITGDGIRAYPYSRDMNVNPQTYADVGGAAVPHGVGSIWCTIIWDLYWDLVNVYGYDTDLYNGTGGNNIAMNLVTQACKYQGCSPTFVSGRDGILAADQALYGGAYECFIWSAFARRGVGFSANAGGTGAGGETEAFDLPPGIGDTPYSFVKTADKSIVSCSEVVTFTLTANTGATTPCVPANPINVDITDILPAGMIYVPNSASNGGTESGGVISWPTVASLSANEAYTYQAIVDCSMLTPNGGVIINDDVESGIDPALTISNASNTSNWVISTTTSNSGNSSWFAEESFITGGFENQYLTIEPFTVKGPTELSFWHNYDTEARYDGGFLEISTDGGATWSRLNSEITMNGYTSYVDGASSQLSWGGSSNGWIQTKVDLSSYENCQPVSIRFNFFYDYSVTGDGWYVDDIMLSTDENTALLNKAVLTENIGSIEDTECVFVQSIYLSPKVFLQGPLTGSLMDVAINAEGMLPNNEPYTALGFTHVNGGGEILFANVGTITGNDRAIDWVFLELRDAATGTNVIATRSALLQADGDVVDVDGTSPVAFSVPAGMYHVAIRHRNHLGVMTNAPVAIN